MDNLHLYLVGIIMAGLSGWLTIIHKKAQRTADIVDAHKTDEDAHWTKREREALTASLKDISRDVKAIRNHEPPEPE